MRESFNERLLRDRMDKDEETMKIIYWMSIAFAMGIWTMM